MVGLSIEEPCVSCRIDYASMSELRLDPEKVFARVIPDSVLRCEGEPQKSGVTKLWLYQLATSIAEEFNKRRQKSLQSVVKTKPKATPAAALRRKQGLIGTGKPAIAAPTPLANKSDGIPASQEPLMLKRIADTKGPMTSQVRSRPWGRRSGKTRGVYVKRICNTRLRKTLCKPRSPLPPSTASPRESAAVAILSPDQRDTPKTSPDKNTPPTKTG